MHVPMQDWLLMGLAVAAIDGVMMYRRFSGARGENVRRWYMLIASRLKGGVPALVILSLAGDITCPPLGLAACPAMAIFERRTYQAERKGRNRVGM